MLVFTAYDTDECVFGALKAGARGYLLKGATTGDIARAIRVVHEGDRISNRASPPSWWPK